MKKNLFFTILSLLLISCSQEVGRVDLLQDNGKTIEFKLEAGETIELYTEMDIEYLDQPLFVYQCEFFKDNEPLFSGGTDPLITTEKTKDVLTLKDGITHWSFYGKLDGNVTADTAGNYAIKTTFIKNNAQGVKINKAAIVFVK